MDHSGRKVLIGAANYRDRCALSHRPEAIGSGMLPSIDSSPDEVRLKLGRGSGEGVPLMQKRDTANEPLLTVLQTAKNRLEYLTPNDWALLVDKAKIVRFKRDEALLQFGKQNRTVYLLLKGNARVDGATQGQIALLGAGEVCGEMAFLENSQASASVVAADEVEAYALEWSALTDLFELFPHLGSRFYRSLAVNLSRRLRDQISAKKTVK